MRRRSRRPVVPGSQPGSLPDALASYDEAGQAAQLSRQHPGRFAVPQKWLFPLLRSAKSRGCARCSTLLPSEVLVIAGARYAQGASQRKLGEIVVVQTGYELIVGAGESLLGLDDFNTVGDAGSEAVPRPSETLIGKLDILLSHCNLFSRGI